MTIKVETLGSMTSFNASPFLRTLFQLGNVSIILVLKTSLPGFERGTVVRNDRADHCDCSYLTVWRH